MPSQEVVRKALAAIKRTVDYQYFFDKLTSPEWIEPLANEGFFKKPPPPEREGNYIRFPIWPESRYLARMANADPERVLQVVLQIPSTENVRVYEDLAEAALGMPPELAARLTDKAKEWARSPYQLLLPDHLGKLISHLARGGESAVALDIARELLAVLPDPRYEVQRDDEDQEAYRPIPEPRARFEQWDYERLLETPVRDLLAASGLNALSLLADLLERAIELSARNQEDTSADYSHIWRPAIEEHRQNSHHGIKDALVSAVRDAAEDLASRDEATLRQVVHLLEPRRYKTFKRIVLHVLRVVPAGPRDLVAKQLADSSLIDETTTHHEFWLLARDRFDMLTDVEQTQLLEAIAAGPPDLDRVRSGLTRWRGHEISDEELDRYVKDWKLRRLSIIGDSLPEASREEFERLEEELGPREHPEFLSYMGELQTGPNTPLEGEKLKEMEVSELVDFLRTWEPSGEWMAPSPEGLSRELSSVVAERPELYAQQALLFKGLDPTYVRGLLSGIEQAQKAGKSFHWAPLLDLCSWVVTQPREIPGRGGEYADLDPGWVWTRKTVASLLSAGFDPGDHQIPIELRQTAWRVLLPVTDDPEPTPEYEAEYGGDNMDPMSLSINTTRGEAMHAVVRYALWVRRDIEAQTNAEEHFARGFEEMPEVRDVLDAHLNPVVDPSLTVRAVYGRWFPWLILLDRSWAEANVVRVFPSTPEHSRLRDAAWDTYVVFCQPYDSSFEVLHKEYRRALERITDHDEKRRRGNPQEHLAQHIMTYYWQGKLPLDEDDNLLALFYSTAPPLLRAAAFEFVGRVMWRSEGEVLDRILTRLMALWEQRLAKAQTADSVVEYRKELAAFGRWFGSGKFDERWAIDNLETVLRLAREIDADHVVAEHLATVTERFPTKAMVCMRLMIEIDKEGWSMLGWRDSARAAIGVALRSGIAEAREAAEDLVHYLGARGHLEFRDLLTH